MTQPPDGDEWNPVWGVMQHWRAGEIALLVLGTLLVGLAVGGLIGAQL